MKLFLTGASGLVGSNIARVARRRGHDITAVVGRFAGTIDGATHTLRLDLADEHAVQRAVLDLFPDAIINAAAVSEPAQCDADPAGSQRVNVGLPAALAGLSHHLGARFIHLSSEQVFDGTRAPYRRDDPASPVNRYGQQKLEAERRAHAAAPTNAVSLRLPLLAGNSATGARSLHERLFAAWAQGRRTCLYRDEIRQPCSAENVAEAAVELSERNDFNGVYHWAGSEALSRAEIGRRIAAHFKLDPAAFIDEGTRADHPGGAAQRQPDLSLDCSPLVGKLKTPQESFDAVLERLHVPVPCRTWYLAGS